MAIPNLYYYLSYLKKLLQVYIGFFSKSNYSNDVLLLFEPSCIDTHFLELEYFNDDNVKPFKSM
jgi:TFIIF-interacting CTD phosphatase-like protein